MAKHRDRVPFLVTLSAALLLALGLVAGCEQEKKPDEPKKEQATSEPAAADDAAAQPGADEPPAPAEHPTDAHDTMAALPRPNKAVAVLVPTEGNDVRGTITFTRTDKGVEVVGSVSGLTPGDHGFHVHEWGDCSAADGASAGGHFNPTSSDHGAPDAAAHHIGDLGNLTAGEDGTANVDVIRPFLSLEGATSIIGRGLIVHADADDLKTQPTGNAGGRVACAVIGIAGVDAAPAPAP